jgi:hypothetical protein
LRGEALKLLPFHFNWNDGYQFEKAEPDAGALIAIFSKPKRILSWNSNGHSETQKVIRLLGHGGSESVAKSQSSSPCSNCSL